MPTRETPSAFYLVMRVHQLVAERLEQELAAHELTASQYTALSVLRRRAPISSAELARRLRITAQATGESVRGLEVRQLVERYGTEENRRIMLLRLTPQGQRLLTKVEKLVNRTEDEFFGSLSIEEREQFVSMLTRLRQASQPAAPGTPGRRTTA